MRGAIPPFLLYAFVAWTKITSNLHKYVIYLRVIIKIVRVSQTQLMNKLLLRRFIQNTNKCTSRLKYYKNPHLAKNTLKTFHRSPTCFGCYFQPSSGSHKVLLKLLMCSIFVVKMAWWQHVVSCTRCLDMLWPVLTLSLRIRPMNVFKVFLAKWGFIIF